MCVIAITGKYNKKEDRSMDSKKKKEEMSSRARRTVPSFGFVGPGASHGITGMHAASGDCQGGCGGQCLSGCKEECITVSK